MKTEDLILWLKSQNITEVAEKTGIPKDRMYKWTNGVASPKTEDFQKLLKYYEDTTGNISTSDKVRDIAKETGKPHEKKPLREAIKQFILGDWLTYERNAKEIEEMAEIIKLLEQKKNDKNQ